MFSKTHLLSALAAVSCLLVAACATRGPAQSSIRGAARLRPADAKVVSFKADVAPLMAARCMGCHTPGGRGSRAVVVFDDAGQVAHASIAAKADTVVRAVESGRMPPRGPKFTEAELAVLRGWRDAGAPNN
ncbi:MAG: cytochrome c [Candidatus Sericytochromatia bacterium]|nr:cytochrome c [Candidatus Sericytochromatia bacterium]